MTFQLHHKINIGNKFARIHGMDGTHFYRVFGRIRERCNSPKKDSYEHYGGRGIKVLWNSFQEFKDDMYESYLAHIEKYGRKNTQIDRIDFDGHYCKENCQWSTIKEQAGNRRNNTFITFKGKTQILEDWSRETGISRYALSYRISKANWPLEKALTTKTHA